jgi:MarR family transcriptional regulator, negative regulator of the multidrug operon emrRAB
MQMNNLSSRIELMEGNLQNLSKHLADVPTTSLLLCRLILHVGRKMSATFAQQLKPFGLVEAEFRVLTTLFSQPDGAAHPTDLCVRASQRAANMSRISDALVKRGLITRGSSVQDRRKMVLTITARGEAFVRDLLPKLWAPLREMLKDIPEAQQSELVAVLKRLGLQLENEPAV